MNRDFSIVVKFSTRHIQNEQYDHGHSEKIDIIQNQNVKITQSHYHAVIIDKGVKCTIRKHKEKKKN